MANIINIHLVSFFILLLTIFISCSERHKNNPFDPNNPGQSPVSLSILPDNDRVHLTWTTQNIKDFKSFRLYRAIGSGDFEIHREFTPDQFSFTDSGLSYYQNYKYKLTVVGFGSETRPSNSVNILPGPGKIWVLSRYGYSVSELSYDLNHIKKTYYTNFPAINWDWNLDIPELWFANAQFRSVSRMKLQSGYEDFIYEDHLTRPIDIKWSPQAQAAFVLDDRLDNQNDHIYMIQNQTVSDSIVLPSAHFFKILTTPHSGLLALDSNRVLHFSGSGFLRDSIPLPDNYRGTDMMIDKDYLYILAKDAPASESMIVQINLSDFSQNEIRFSGDFAIFTKNDTLSYFWASENLGGNSSRLVKLSSEGHRLLELNSLSGEIDDININPHDNSIILVQRYRNNVVLYDSLGNQLTQGNKIYDPIKVFIY